jgi:hypothetical protein
MKRYLIILAFVGCLSLPASAQWTVVQSFLGPRTTSCGGLSSQTLTCTIGPLATATSGCLTSTCQAIAAGDPLTLLFGSGGDYENGTQQLITSVSDCVTLTSGNCATSLNTWVLHQAGGITQCPAYVTGNNNTFQTDCATVDPSASGGVVGGALYIAFTRNNDGGESLGFTYNAAFVELNNPGGAKLDSVASYSDTVSGTSHVMVATTVTGTDAIIQFMDGNPASVSSPYTFASDAGHQAVETAVNQTSGSAPTQTGSLSNPMAGSAVAWTYTGAVAGSSLSGVSLSGAKVQ